MSAPEASFLSLGLEPQTGRQEQLSWPPASSPPPSIRVHTRHAVAVPGNAGRTGSRTPLPDLEHLPQPGHPPGHRMWPLLFPGEPPLPPKPWFLRWWALTWHPQHGDPWG